MGRKGAHNGHLPGAILCSSSLPGNRRVDCLLLFDVRHEENQVLETQLFFCKLFLALRILMHEMQTTFENIKGYLARGFGLQFVNWNVSSEF